MKNDTLGKLGEQWVSGWLRRQGWQILFRRWRCRWGEIDLIALTPEPHILVFIEVKTRSDRSWDVGGLLAITPKKQQRLRQAAMLFMGQNPDWADHPCRFDIVLIHCQGNAKSGYRLSLHQHLEAAFE